MFEPFSYTDYAEAAVEAAQELVKARDGEAALKHRVWGVRVVPRPQRPRF